jgi:hypothetical protein
MQSRIKIIVVFVIVYLAFLHSFTVNAQARMVMNNNAFLVIENSAKLVITNGNPNAISTSGSGGNLITEDEFDQLYWHIGSAGIFTIPFTNEGGVKIPMTLNISTPGAGTVMSFATYKGPTWDNSAYLPFGVTHITNSSGANNSANVIDRFWVMYPEFPGGEPVVGNISLSYDDVEHSAAGNSIAEANLVGQRFNDFLLTWGDYIPTGTCNTVTNTVSGITFNGNFKRVWTLVESDNPMPVELISFNHECENDFTELKWITASETNNMFFTVEKSENGMVFETVKTIAGAGNSNMPLEYSTNVEPNKYYRLSQTDYNGTTEEIGNLYANCMNANEMVWWQSMEKLNDVKISGLEEGVLEYQLYDMSGKLILNENQSVSSANFMIQLPELPNGMYTISFKNNDRVVAGKVMMVR